MARSKEVNDDLLLCISFFTEASPPLTVRLDSTFSNPSFDFDLLFLCHGNRLFLLLSSALLKLFFNFIGVAPVVFVLFARHCLYTSDFKNLSKNKSNYRRYDLNDSVSYTQKILLEKFFYFYVQTDSSIIN